MLPMTTEQAVLHGHCRVDHRTPHSEVAVRDRGSTTTSRDTPMR